MNSLIFMRMRHILLSIFFLVLLISSCGRTDCITTSHSIGIIFEGYDTDTGVQVIVRQYSSGTNTVPIWQDTLEIDSNYTYRKTFDSTSGWSRINAGCSAEVGYVTEVVVPSTGKRDVISGIEFTHDTRKKSFMEGGGWGNQCINVCTGYFLNGEHHNTEYTAAVPYGGSTGTTVTLRK
jgi:hypothetical protein